MEIRILGSFDVVGSAGVVDLRGVKRRGLLACLVVHAGRPISTDRLVSEPSGDGGSEGATRTVQTHVSQLRKLVRGEPASLDRRPGGYVLAVDPAVVDAYRFEQAVTAALIEPDPARRPPSLTDIRLSGGSCRSSSGPSGRGTGLRSAGTGGLGT